ncbi:hypothetical protein F5Y01DRAFT_326663 [Xylaria sp. FL0043]|nr:hypothetical protein F5Y01DRAFT_326663 [Xylaria sp. FL0043]
MGQKLTSLCRSTGSIAPQPCSQDTDDDALFLPTSDQVYLTHTKNGKPALGRKKTSRLLQDHGFDILGQSFGIPSRKDYEGRARPLSVASQSSGLITAQSTPRKSRPAYAFDDDNEPPIASRKTSNTNSSPTTLPMEVARKNDRSISNVHQRAAYSTQPPFMKPQGFDVRHVPPPPPPPLSAMGWGRHPAMNTGVAPVPMNSYSAPYQPSRAPSYSHNGAAMFQGIPNSQHNMVAQYPNYLGMSAPQTIAVPMLPYQQQVREAQAAGIAQLRARTAIPQANIFPPPPPPPPQEWLQARGMSTGRRGLFRQETKRGSNAKKPFEQFDQDETPPVDTRQTNEKSRNNEDVRRQLSKRIRHVHVCAGCGKKRSARYQRAHPLKRGEIPELNYCYSCLKDAADTDYYESDAASVSGSSYRKHHRETSVPWPSSDEARTIADGEYSYEHSRHGRRWVKKSNRLGPLSKLFSRKSASSYLPPGWSGSSAEESRSRASSPVSDMYSLRGTSRPSVRRRHRGASNATVRQAKRVASPRRRRDSTDSWSTRYCSLPGSSEEYLSKAKNEGKLRTTSNNKQTTARPRSRIPRPQPRPRARSTDTDSPPLADMDDLAHILGSSLRLDTTGGTTEAPTSPRMERSPAPSHNVIPDKARRPVKQDTHGSTCEEVKTRCLSSEIVDHANALSDADRSGIQTSMNESSRTSLAAGPETVLKETTNKPNDHSRPNYTSAGTQVPSNCIPRINVEQAETLYEFSSSGGSRRQPLSDEGLGGANERKATFNWNEPLTPLDVPYAGNSHSPRVMADSWSGYQTDLEREAEETAERDLAFAGKLFDSLSASFGGSATSAFPMSSFVATSNRSIVSYNSDSDHSDVDAAVPIITELDVEEDTEAIKLTPRIEFSSEGEQERKKFAKPRSPTELTVPHVQHPVGRIYELPDDYNENLYDEDDYDVEYYFPSPIGSSLIGHTGHSADELVRNTTPPDTHRPRGLLRLLSA